MLSSIPAVSSLHLSTQTHVTDRRFSVCLIIATCILNNFCLKTIHILTLACCIRHV